MKHSENFRKREIKEREKSKHIKGAKEKRGERERGKGAR
jgi:hypothetical protein